MPAFHTFLAVIIVLTKRAIIGRKGWSAPVEVKFQYRETIFLLKIR